VRSASNSSRSHDIDLFGSKTGWVPGHSIDAFGMSIVTGVSPRSVSSLRGPLGSQSLLLEGNKSRSKAVLPDRKLKRDSEIRYDHKPTSTRQCAPGEIYPANAISPRMQSDHDDPGGLCRAISARFTTSGQCPGARDLSGDPILASIRARSYGA
jgi:hypothetical protein